MRTVTCLIQAPVKILIWLWAFWRQDSVSTNVCEEIYLWKTEGREEEVSFGTRKRVCQHAVCSADVDDLVKLSRNSCGSSEQVNLWKSTESGLNDLLPFIPEGTLSLQGDILRWTSRQDTARKEVTLSSDFACVKFQPERRLELELRQVEQIGLN